MVDEHLVGGQKSAKCLIVENLSSPHRHKQIHTDTPKGKGSVYILKHKWRKDYAIKCPV